MFTNTVKLGETTLAKIGVCNATSAHPLPNWYNSLSLAWTYDDDVSHDEDKWWCSFWCITSWSPRPVSDETAFESIKASLDAVPAGMKMLLNTGTPCWASLTICSNNELQANSTVTSPMKQPTWIWLLASLRSILGMLIKLSCLWRYSVCYSFSRNYIDESHRAVQSKEHSSPTTRE